MDAEDQAFIDAEKQRLGVTTNAELLKAMVREVRKPEPATLADELAKACEIAQFRGWDAAALSFSSIVTARIKALEAALRAFHYYVAASDRELQDDSLTREDALRKAYTLHDAALPHP